MIIQYIKGLLFLAVLAFCIPASASLPADSNNYFVSYTITSLSSDGTSCTLSDGTTWSFMNPVGIPWQQGDSIWLVPFMQGVGTQLAAVLFDSFWTYTASAYLNTGSTSITIDSITTNGTIGLSDGSSWTLDPYYAKYTADWQVGDPITIAGRHNEYYLINGNDRQTGMNMTYSLVSHNHSQPR